MPKRPHVKITDPAKPSWPCHHGQPCSCGDADSQETRRTAGPSEALGSPEFRFSKKNLDLAMSVCQWLWDNQKISYNWDSIKDVEFLAHVIENRKMP